MNPLTFLSADEVESIHRATLRILAETGMVLTEPHSRAILTAAGARLQDHRVLFPPELVEGSIARAGKKTTVRGRGGAVKTLGDGNLYFHNLGGAPNVFEAASGIRRPATVRDVCEATRLLDAVGNCHTVTPFFTPTDVPGGVMSLAMYRHALPYTLKPLQGPGVQYAAEARYAVEMAKVIGEPTEMLTLSSHRSARSPFPTMKRWPSSKLRSWASPSVRYPVPPRGRRRRSPSLARWPSRTPKCWRRWCWRNWFDRDCR